MKEIILDIAIVDKDWEEISNLCKKNGRDVSVDCCKQRLKLLNKKGKFPAFEIANGKVNFPNFSISESFILEEEIQSTSVTEPRGEEIQSTSFTQNKPVALDKLQPNGSTELTIILPISDYPNPSPIEFTIKIPIGSFQESKKWSKRELHELIKFIIERKFKIALGDWNYFQSTTYWKHFKTHKNWKLMNDDKKSILAYKPQVPDIVETLYARTQIRKTYVDYIQKLKDINSRIDFEIVGGKILREEIL